MKIRWFIPAIPLVLVFLALAGGFDVVWQVFLFVTVVFLLSLLWSLFSLHRVSARVPASRDRAQVGERYEQEFWLENSGAIPAPVVEAREQSNMPGYENLTTFSLLGRSPRRWRTTVECRKRGSYTMGPLKVTVSDPLGLFPASRDFGKPGQVLVYPRVHELPNFHVIPRQEAGRSQRRWMASEAGSGASKVREYTSGDSLRHVHWPTTAHSGRLMVKEFDPERAHYTFRHVWIVLDMYARHLYGHGAETTEEYAVSAAASLAVKFIRDGKDVGLMAAGDRTVLHLPAGGGFQEERILRSLAVLRNTGNMPVVKLLAAEADHFESGSAVIVIMPAAQQDILTPLRRALNRSILLTVVLLDIASFGGPTFPEADARRFEGVGYSTYTIRRGQEITSALDSRLEFVNAPKVVGAKR